MLLLYKNHKITLNPFFFQEVLLHIKYKMIELKLLKNIKINKVLIKYKVFYPKNH